MRLIVNIEAGNLVDVEEIAPGHFRARMKPEANSVYPYPTHQLCWFICRLEGIRPGGESCKLTLVNCEWNPDAFRTQRPFLCYEPDWSRSAAWSHEGLTGMQLDWTRSESSRGVPGPRAPRDGREGRDVPAQTAPAAPASPAAPTAVALVPATPSATPATARTRSTPPPFNKHESATLSLFPPAEPAPQAAATPAVPATPAPSTLPAATAVATPPPGAKATELPKSLQAAGTPVPSSEIAGMSRDFTGGSMTYTFHLKSDCTVALHPPYTLEMLKTDLERWGVSPHLHYQRLGASHGGKSFFVVEAARHRNKG
ncbi:MAG TPA: hypothetical protein VL860_10395, partial [Planctomycetota bacterium]|nr:hypothetical protein [Planctomycetota bacterium]